MPATTPNLVQLIQTLETQKSQHAQISVAIASTLEQIRGLLGALIGGGQAAAPRPAKATAAPVTAKAAPAAAPAKKAAGRRKRQKFEVSGEQSIINFIREKKNPTTAQIRQHWDAEGRGGTADNVLSKLVAAKKLKREPMKDGRGSRYTVA